jgi:nucleotide-binding universal stress UspA family protein
VKPIRFSRILCPVTFSDDSQRTVEGAAILAGMYGAELRLFHVASANSDGARDAESLIASLFAFSRRLPDRLRISAAVAYGDPSLEITQHAQLMRADLIVLGANARSAPAEFAHTVPAKVATCPPCSVLVVRPRLAPALADSGRGFADVLCCADFLTSSAESAAYVQAMTHSGHARVTMLTVLSERNEEPALADENNSSVDDRTQGVHVVLTGSPGPEIVGLARRIESDLIVMGAGGDVPAEREHGSTATYVMACAPCSVLIVPPSKVAPRVRFQNELTVST